MISHKTSLSKLKETEIIPSIFSDHHSMKLEINYWKKHKHVEAKQHAAKWPMGQWRNQSGNKKYLKNNENRTMQNLWDVAKAVLRGSFWCYRPTWRNRKISNNLTLHTPKRIRKRTKSKVRRMEIMMIRGEIKEIDKNPKQRINGTELVLWQDK